VRTSKREMKAVILGLSRQPAALLEEFP
jgi:hypothetical protein